MVPPTDPAVIERRPADMRCRALEPGSDKRNTDVEQCQKPITFVLMTGRMVPDDPGTRSVDDSLAYFSIYCPTHRATNNAMWGQRDASGNRIGVQRILDFQTADTWTDPVEGGKRDEGRTRTSELHSSNLAFDFLFVVKDAGSTTVPDQEIIDRLERIGGTVLLKSEDDTYIDTDSNWEISDAAGISESVSSSTVGTSGKDADVGIAAWEPGIWDDHEYSSVAGSNTQDSNQVQFPITHALNAGAAGNRTTPRLDAQVVDTSIASVRIFSTLVLSNMGPDAAKVLTVLRSTNHTLIAYDTGDIMDGSFTAPNRRVANGFLRVDTSAGTQAVDESTDGYTLNEAGWYLAVDVTVNWILGIDIEVSRQVGFPTVEEHLDTGWTAPTNGVDDINDLVPSIVAFYDSGTTDGAVAVFKLSTLDDPQNNAHHALVAAWRKAGSGAAVAPGMKMQLMEGWVSEPSSIGTERGTVDFAVTAVTIPEHAGTYLVLTESQADAITDYSDLYARFTFTKNSNRTILIVNLEWTLDGAADAAAPLIARRRQLTTVRL